MDIMDGMDTMDFPFDGRMDWFKDATCLYVSMMSIASIVSLSIKNETFSDVLRE